MFLLGARENRTVIRSNRRFFLKKAVAKREQITLYNSSDVSRLKQGRKL